MVDSAAVGAATGMRSAWGIVATAAAGAPHRRRPLALTATFGLVVAEAVVDKRPSTPAHCAGPVCVADDHRRRRQACFSAAPNAGHDSIPGGCGRVGNITRRHIRRLRDPPPIPWHGYRRSGRCCRSDNHPHDAPPREVNEGRLRRRLSEPLSWWGYISSADFGNRTLQNWQSEFLAVASMVVLSIYLRQRGSPESKPVGSTHTSTGVEG